MKHFLGRVTHSHLDSRIAPTVGNLSLPAKQLTGRLGQYIIFFFANGFAEFLIKRVIKPGPIARDIVLALRIVNVLFTSASASALLRVTRQATHESGWVMIDAMMEW